MFAGICAHIYPSAIPQRTTQSSMLATNHNLHTGMVENAIRSRRSTYKNQKVYIRLHSVHRRS
jgi:hypothetical protein